MLIVAFALLGFGLFAPALTALGAITLGGWAVHRVRSLLAAVAALRAELAEARAGADGRPEPAGQTAPLAPRADRSAAAPPAPAPPATHRAAAPPPPPGVPTPTSAGVPATAAATVPAAARPAGAMTAQTPQLPPPPAQAPPSPINTEARLGTVWFSRIGGVLLLIGALLAYRYGITDNTLRTVIGFAAGLSLLGLGHWGRRRQHPVLAQALTGTGLGVLYVTTHAAAVIFTPAIIGQPLAFALMVAITIAGVALAVGYNAPVIGLLAMLGGLATPFALSSGTGDFRLLFAYVAVLDLSLLAVAAFKRWPLYNYLLFAATWLIYVSWWITAAEPADYPHAFIAATAFFLIFTLLTLTQHVLRRQPARPGDLVLLIGNALIYFGAGLALLPVAAPGRAAFAFAMAAAYALFGAVARRRQPDDRLLSVSLIGLSTVFLTIALPVALHGPWLTAAWAVEGAVLIAAGLTAQARDVRTAGLIVLGVVAIRLTVWETALILGRLYDSEPGFGLRLLTFAVPVLALYAASWMYARWQRHREAAGLLASAASVLTLWYVVVEVVMRRVVLPPVPAPAAAALTVTALWGAYALLLALADVWIGRPAVATAPAPSSVWRCCCCSAR